MRVGRKTSKRSGKKVARKVRRRRQARSASERASARQTIDLPDDVLNQVYRLDDVNLSQFDRLTNIAQSYQFFRFTKIEMMFKPAQDTFVANGERVPYLHYLIDTGEVLNVLPAPAGFNQLRDAGAKPIRFDDKSIHVSWSPRVPMATASDSTSTPALTYNMSTKKSPWLPTNNAANVDAFGWVPSSTPHKGLYYGVEANALMADRTYNVAITVHCEYRKPLIVPPNNGETGIAPQKKILKKTYEVPV